MTCSNRNLRFQSPRPGGVLRQCVNGAGCVLNFLGRWTARIVHGVVVGMSAGLQAIFTRPAKPLPVAKPVVAQPIRTPDLPQRTRPMDKHHKQGPGKRIIWILVIGMIAAGVVSMATTKQERYVSPPPAPEPWAKLSARKLQALAADSAIVAGAQTGRAELLSQFGPRSPQYIAVTNFEPQAEATDPNQSIRLQKIRSDAPHVDEKRAELDALLVAQQRLSQQLRNLNPPIDTIPSIELIRQEYIKPNSFVKVQPTEEDRRLWAEKKLEVNRVWVEINALEVSPDQLRELRSTDRLELAGWFAGAVMLVLAAAYGFLRFDAWTRGYLTMVLGLGFAAAAGGAVALLFWMR